MAEQQPRNPDPKPNDRINQNVPVEFPELPPDDEKGRVLRPEGGIDKDLDPSENQQRYSKPGKGTVEDAPGPDDQVI